VHRSFVYAFTRPCRGRYECFSATSIFSATHIHARKGLILAAAGQSLRVTTIQVEDGDAS
jgi:hypothetical protein